MRVFSTFLDAQQWCKRVAEGNCSVLVEDPALPHDGLAYLWDGQLDVAYFE